MALVPARSNLKTNPLYISLSGEKVFTCGDHVKGVIRVDPTLRPQRINVSFKGYSVFNETANGLKPGFFDYTQDLFVSAGAHENLDILRRGTAQDGRVELPFDFIFPDTASLPPPSERNWHHSNDSYDHPRFQHSPGFALPPSLPREVSSNPPLSARIVYSIEATMDSNVPRMVVLQELKFAPPAPEYDLALLQPHLELGTKLPKQYCRYKFIRTRRLLPGYESTSKLSRIKDLLVEKELFFGLETLSEVPFAKFNILAVPARVLVLGSSVPIIVAVQHLERSRSLPSPPDLFIRRIRVQLLSAINIFIPVIANDRGAGKENVDAIRETFILFDRKFDEGNGEPLYDGLNLAELGVVKLDHEKLIPSFTSYGMALEYELQVEVFGECAKHEFSGIVCREQVQIVLPWNARPPPDDAVASSSSAADTHPRPEYQEVDPMVATAPRLSSEEGIFTVPMPSNYDFGAPSLSSASRLETVPVVGPRPMPPPYVA